MGARAPRPSPRSSKKQAWARKARKPNPDPYSIREGPGTHQAYEVNAHSADAAQASRGPRRRTCAQAWRATDHWRMILRNSSSLVALLVRWSTAKPEQTGWVCRTLVQDTMLEVGPE
eukprot:12847006-Alexandrium_andersonii.AAC.1